MEATHIISALSALAQEHRLAVFRLLVQAGPQGLPAGAIAEKLGVPASSLSFHLSQLLNAGLVQQQRAGRSLIYSANYQTMDQVVGYLTENCCAGAANPACTTDCAPADSSAGTCS